ncbi:MAG: NAD(P)-binding domain-containing protein [Simplicispira sp.]|nr:NAD(P)-binding domain-containing protein [Simplicispira sp.]
MRCWGLVRAGWPLKNIVVVEPHPPQQAVLREQLGVRVLARADASLQQGSIVVWALKPDMVQAAANATVGFLADPLHLSIAAGVSLPDLVRCFGSSRVVRAMPNTPALVGAGVTGMLPAAGVSEADKALAEGVLSVAGRVFSVRSDEEMDAVTAISGSGQATCSSYWKASKPQQKRWVSTLRKLSNWCWTSWPARCFLPSRRTLNMRHCANV